jgi:hypothetical protein
MASATNDEADALFAGPHDVGCSPYMVENHRSHWDGPHFRRAGSTRRMNVGHSPTYMVIGIEHVATYGGFVGRV